MGFFTWTLANRKPVILGNGDFSTSCKLRYNHYGAIVCPDNTLIEEPDYEGYGMFNGQNVYELVVDWNRNHLLSIIQNPAFEKEKSLGDELTEIIKAYAAYDDAALQIAIDNAAKEAPYIKKDWKRCMGIHIACGDNNKLLPYPIKIVDKPIKTPYAKLHPSKSTQ